MLRAGFRAKAIGLHDVRLKKCVSDISGLDISGFNSHELGSNDKDSAGDVEPIKSLVNVTGNGGEIGPTEFRSLTDPAEVL